MARDTVRPAAALEAWTSFVRAGLGAAGLLLLGVAPRVAAPASFPALPLYAFVLGGVLVVAAATMRLRSLLAVLGCLALAAGLAAGLADPGEPAANRSALGLYCAAAVLLGAAARRSWAALPFLLVPLLVLAPSPSGGWAASRDAFASAWVAAMGGRHLWAGLPAGLALAGAFVGASRGRPWAPVRPSAVPLLLLCAGIVFGGLVVASLLPEALAFARTVCLRAALIAGVLGWVALAYQAGRAALVWQSALACLLTLAGAMLVDAGHDYALDAAVGATVLAALLPSLLAAFGLVLRRWVGTERPRAMAATASDAPRPVEKGAFFAPAPPPEPVLPTPLAPSGLGSTSERKETPKPDADEPAEATQNEGKP